VFGASIIAPKKGGGHVELYLLLVSEVLDHDAQAANMLINEVVGIVKSHPEGLAIACSDGQTAG